MKKRPVSSSNKTVVTSIICLIISLGIILTIIPESDPVHLSLTKKLPVVIDKDNPLLLSFKAPETSYSKIRISFESSGPLALRGETATLLFPGRRYLENREAYQCTENNGTLICEVLINIDYPGKQLRLEAPDRPMTLYSLNHSTIKSKHQTSLANLRGSKLLWLSLFSGGLLFSILLYRRAPKLTQWGIIGIVLSFIGATDFEFAVALFLFLSGMYAVRERISSTSGAITKLLIVLSLSCFFLIFFKYIKIFFAEWQSLGVGFSLLFPIGTSYFVIRLIDTQLCWYRRQNLDYSYRDFLFFILFPGTLIAGPIESLRDFYNKRLKRLDKEDLAYGIARIILGLFKKIIIADHYLFPVIHGERFKNILWLATGGSESRLILDAPDAAGYEILAFAVSGLLFAYVDFSAYSDLAIGFSRLMGHRIRENFNFPFLARNLRHFWQRWHISLSEWSFRNAYFPLLVKSRNSFIPLFITMLLIGMWHSPNLSWYSWALHHAIGLSLVAFLQKRFPLSGWINYALYPVSTALTFIYVAMGFIFVYFNDYSIASKLYLNLWKWILTLGGTV